MHKDVVEEVELLSKEEEEKVSEKAINKIGECSYLLCDEVACAFINSVR